MAHPLAAAFLVGLHLLGWQSPELSVYFRLKELLVSVQAPSPTYDPDLAEVAERARGLLTGCGFHEADGRLVRRAVGEVLRERGRFGLGFVAFDAASADDALASVREYLATSPILPTVERVGVGGVARTGGATPERVLVLLAATRVKLPELPPERWTGDRVLFWGELPATHRDPAVLVLTDAGEVRRFAPQVSRELFYVDLPLEGLRRARIEVQARGPHGAEVLALFDAGADVASGCAALSEAAPPGPVPTATDEAEDALLGWINELRAEHGLRALALDPLLARAARAHSRSMAQGGFVGHVGPSAGPLSRRLVLRDIRFRRALENVAAGTNVWEAHVELTRTPSHRLNLLDAGVGVAGIGVVQDQGVYFVTEELVER